MRPARPTFAGYTPWKGSARTRRTGSAGLPYFWRKDYGQMMPRAPNIVLIEHGAFVYQYDYYTQLEDWESCHRISKWGTEWLQRGVSAPAAGRRASARMRSWIGLRRAPRTSTPWSLAVSPTAADGHHESIQTCSNCANNSGGTTGIPSSSRWVPTVRPYPHRPLFWAWEVHKRAIQPSIAPRNHLQSALSAPERNHARPRHVSKIGATI